MIFLWKILTFELSNINNIIANYFNQLSFAIIITPKFPLQYHLIYSFFPLDVLL